ncbi:MAG TPA: NAD(P)H-quinone oxidoreductase [Devosiaceae bacterium]
MTAIAITAPGGPEVLQAVAVATPQPGPGDVLIRVAAAGINYPDLAQRRGKYDPPSWHSPHPGLEVSGEIAALGEGVSSFVLGDRVLALCNGGGYADYVTVPAGQVLPVPHGVALIQAGAMAETWFTVQQTLVMRAGLLPGMNVLIHGAAGGIGNAAIALSLIHGARPIAVVSTTDKADYAKQLGAADTILHTSEDFVARAQQLTDGKGADRIVALAGGDMLPRNMAAAARFATIVQLATLGDANADIPLGLLLGRALTLIGSTLRPQSNATKTAIAQGLLETAWPAFAAGQVKLPRLRTLPLREAAAAHQAMEERDSYGKIALVTAFGQAFLNDKSVAPR